MRELSNTKAIFKQIGSTPGGLGVKTIIENHDAWLHNDEIQFTVALRTQLMAQRRPEAVARRIEAQRSGLDRLVTRLPVRFATAG